MSGKSLTSWVAAADSERRSWPTACTRKTAASWSILPPAARTSLAANPGNSADFSSADFTSVTLACLRSLVRTPEPFCPPAVDQHQGDVLDR